MSTPPVIEVRNVSKHFTRRPRSFEARRARRLGREK